MKKYVYVEGEDKQITDMFKEEGWGIAANLFVADLLCLKGGADVSPEIYGEQNTFSYPNPEEDYVTFGLISLAEYLDIPMVGICRGHQALFVYNRGKLNQHISGHQNCTHTIKYDGVTEYTVIGDHHQSIVDPERYGNVSYSTDGCCEILEYIYGDLGVQFHPEWAEKGHESRELFFKLVGDMFND